MTPVHKRPLDGLRDATDPMRRVVVSVTSDMSPMSPMAPMAPMPTPAPVPIAPMAPMPTAKRYRQQAIEQYHCDDWADNLPPFAAANASPLALQTRQPQPTQSDSRPPGQRPPRGHWPGPLSGPLPWRPTTPPATPPGTPPTSPSPPGQRQPPGQWPLEPPLEPPPLEPQPVQPRIADVYVEVGRILGFDSLPWQDHPQRFKASHLDSSGKWIELQCTIPVELGLFASEAHATIFAQLAKAIYTTPQTGVTLRTLAEATRVLLCHRHDFLSEWVLEPVRLASQDHKNSICVRQTTDGQWSAVASIHRKWGRFATNELKALGKGLLESGRVDEGAAFCALLNRAAEEAGVPEAGGGDVAIAVIRRGPAENPNPDKTPPLLLALMEARLAPPAAQVTLETQAALEALARVRAEPGAPCALGAAPVQPAAVRPERARARNAAAPVQPAAVRPKRARARNVAAPAPAAGPVTLSWMHPADALSSRAVLTQWSNSAIDDRVRRFEVEQRGYPSLVAMHIAPAFLDAICCDGATQSATPIDLGGLMAARQLWQFRT